MGKVGIISNPLSGKDIRRLVASGMVCSSNRKINIILRLLQGLDAAGAAEVIIMPDIYGIGQEAKEEFYRRNKPPIEVTFLDMPLLTNGEDSYRAASMMKELGVQCIITLGGDGTNRMVAKACGETPILPISTGTNNVFPFTVEATVAGMAAGMITAGILDQGEAIRRRKKLDVLRAEEVIDIALIDVVVTSENAVGARAIWDVGRISQIVQTCGSLSGIGLSSIGGCFHHVSSSDNFGISVEIGKGGRPVLAPIAPGLIKEVNVRAAHIIDIDERVPVQSAPVVLALDGERELKLRCCDDIFVRLSDMGPRVVDVYTALRLATEKGLLRIGR